VDDRLDMRLKAGAVETAHRFAPWRGDIEWWVVGIQGIVALLLGLWLFLNQGAGESVLAVLGVVLLVISVLWAWTAMRSDLPQVVLGWRGLRGGVGILAGTLVVLDFVVDFLAPAAALVVFAVGLLIAGSIGIAEWLAGRKAMGWRWPSIIGSAVAAGYGIIVLASRLQAGSLFLQVFAAVMVVGGIALIVRAGLLWRQDQLNRGAPASAGSGSTAPTPVRQEPAGSGAPPVTVRSAGSSKGGDQGSPPASSGG
jgi:uncharacterized membrane protein HdeD (DUF308 family)